MDAAFEKRSTPAGASCGSGIEIITTDIILPDDQYIAFISYAHRYQPWVEVFHAHLERCLDHLGRPERVFLDKSDLRLGPSWVTQLQSALDASRHLIVLTTPEAMASPRVTDEWDALIATDRSWKQRLLPIHLVETPLPPFLANSQAPSFVDHTSDQYLAALRRVVNALLERGSARDLLRLPSGLAPPAPPTGRLPPDIRQELVAFLSPLMGSEAMQQALARKLGLAHVDCLRDYPSKDTRASACIELAISDASPIEHAVRMIDAVAKVAEREHKDVAPLEPIRSRLVEDRARRDATAPKVKYDDERSRTVAEALEAALDREADLASQGEDATTIAAEILNLKRELRDGPMLKAGDFLDKRFKLIERLGQGGFATIWKAWDRKTRTSVAAKVLHGQYAHDRGRIARFFRGARKMAALRHPGIVAVPEPELRDGDFHFFAMDLVSGGDLRDAVRAGRVPADAVQPLVTRIAEALEAAHEADLVHRDIKPPNILIDEAGRPKITDFDLVRAADTTHGTRTGMMGTFIYVAPEMMERPQHVGPEADVFGLGMTAAFVVHGQDLPGRALWDSETFFQSLEIPRKVRTVLLQAVAKEPRERFPTVTAFRRAWQSAWDAPDEPPVEHPPAPAPHRRSHPRHGEAERIDIESFGEADLENRREMLLAVPDQLSDPDRCLALVEQLRPNASDGNDLFFLEWIVDEVATRWPDRATVADEIREHLFDHLPTPEGARELFIDFETAKGESPRLWCTIPNGRGIIGSRKGQGHDYERPQHAIEVAAPYALAAVPITRAQYRAFDPSKEMHRFEGIEDDDLDHHPAIDVTWYGAVAFCRWLDRRLGFRDARLPTEEEWEHACRGTSDADTEYWSGDGKKALREIGWFDDNSERRTHRVAEKEPNPLGLYDVHGNVWEWTISEWDGKRYKDRSSTDPFPVDPRQLPADLAATPGVPRVLRGGSCWSSADGCRSAFRYHWLPVNEFRYLGFRVLLPRPPETLDP